VLDIPEFVSKGVIGVIAYLGGLATKPIQTAWEERRARKMLQRSLYMELGDNYNQLFKLQGYALKGKSGENLEIEEFTSNYINVDCYEHGKKEKPILFNQLVEANHLKNLFIGFAAMKQQKLVTRAELFNCCQAQLQALNERLLGQLIHVGLLIKHIDPAYRKTVQEMTTHKLLYAIVQENE
jgi:hypothetical protein